MVRTLNPERKAQFMNAALKLFSENGVQNTSTAEIAKEAGSAAGTLFLYFPTKQDLIHALVIKIGKDQSDYIKALLEPTLTIRDTFFTIWTGSIRWFMENKDAYRYIQQVRDSGLVGAAVVQESAEFFDYYYDAIRRGVAEGSLKLYPLELIGSILYQDIIAMMNLIRTQSERARQEESIQMGFNIFWDGIKAGHDRSSSQEKNHEL
jgi:AcrR family transcriptional regulator